MREIAQEITRNAKTNDNVNQLFVDNYNYISTFFRDEALVAEAYMVITTKDDVTPQNFMKKYGGIYNNLKRLHRMHDPLVLDIGEVMNDIADDSEIDLDRHDVIPDKPSRRIPKPKLRKNIIRDMLNANNQSHSKTAKEKLHS